MLFNSLTFILIFLPITWCTWRLVLRWYGLRPALATLVISSLIFYGWWDPHYVPGFIGSILFNFWIGRRIIASQTLGKSQRARYWLILGIAFDLGILGIFKYAYFIATNLVAVFGGMVPFAPLVLPLGISFITFQQIAYLIDCKKGEVKEPGLLNYLVFISFFPQLIAGPIVHHRPLIAQLYPNNPLLSLNPYWPNAFSLFAIGLFKKVILADTLASYATPAFSAAAAGPIDGGTAWQGTLAYSLQIYFDFSGYSDMAIGLGLLFGIRLPVNFDSPYRAPSIRAFWRRWNMTLSSFLRDYVYIPLGGNRQGIRHQFRNLLLTMLLGGLWHGAGWTFILWGALHGVLLVIDHAWRVVRTHLSALNRLAKWLPQPISIGLTFALVSLSWVLFRAPDLYVAARIYEGLTDLQGLLASLRATPWPLDLAFLQSWLAAEPKFGWVWIGMGLVIVWILPTGWRWVGYDPDPSRPMSLRPGLWYGLVAGALLWIAIKTLMTAPPSEFLYFNF